MENLDKKEIEILDELLRIDKDIVDKAIQLSKLYYEISWWYWKEKNEKKAEYRKIYNEVIVMSNHEDELLKCLNSEKVDSYINYIYTKIYGNQKDYFSNEKCKLLYALLNKGRSFRTITLLENMNLNENEKKLKTNFANLFIHYLEPAFSDEAYFTEYCECKYVANVLLVRENDKLFEDFKDLQLIDCENADYKDYIDMFYNHYTNIDIADFHFDEDEVVVESYISRAIIGAILAMLPEKEFNELKGKITEKIMKIHDNNVKEKKEFKERMEKEGPKDPIFQYMDYYIQSVRTKSCFEYMIEACFDTAGRDRQKIQIIEKNEYIKK